MSGSAAGTAVQDEHERAGEERPAEQFESVCGVGLWGDENQRHDD
jgi:hypothetical protein